MTLADFNRGADLTAETVEAFGASGNPLIDGLWSKPAASIRQHEAIGIGLFETLLAGSSRDIRARVHRAIRALPLSWGTYWFLYQDRRLRGNSSDWADAVAALLIRMPLAHAMHRGGHYGSARPVIVACLHQLLLSSHVKGLDYDRPLQARMGQIVDVVAWFARNDPDASRDIGLAMAPLMQFLWDRRADGGLAGDTRESIHRLYTFLDQNLDVCARMPGAWPSIHEYCLKALGIAPRDSIVWQLQDDLPGLVNAFKRSLSRRIGADLAERLLSDDRLDPAELCRAGQATDMLLRLLRARELWRGTAGLGRENSYDILHRALDAFRNWRDLNDMIRGVAAVDAPASDAQMAELVRSLAGAGNIVAEQIVPRALQRARMPGFPMTRQALEDLPVTGEMNVVPYFDETLRKVKRGLRSI
ncbi:hypothetical protein FHS95_003996 [Sphingomonas naasensis]|uniref:Uncharacterized protein n=1 Tax=Sphingomonas naasensis TaxID=1344951 RepID=A0A4S1WGN6_9SPHN|nr:hypothetical protein [Sphingomonas naasensis]NIJ22281.1 hypothetical protein [Sphingomonas naasensis]TGX40710.1 hypothetical protein E5A74_14545 [Sphingomonas naasensis]